jgi:hypothetical protein
MLKRKKYFKQLKNYKTPPQEGLGEAVIYE